MAGFISHKGKVKMYGEIEELGSYPSVFNYRIEEVKGKYGVVDLTTFKWVVKPQATRIYDIKYSSARKVESFSAKDKKEVNVFFRISDGKDVHYMDLKSYKYQPKDR